MTEKLLCKCTHLVTSHNFNNEIGEGPCWITRRDRYGIKPCSCMSFREMTNLEYLEYKYEISSK